MITPNNEGEGETLVLDKFAISTLHTKLGIVNKLSSELEKRCAQYHTFCKSIGMTKDPYNGKDYSGRYCDILLKNLDKLEEVVGEELLPIVTTLVDAVSYTHLTLPTKA